MAESVVIAAKARQSRGSRAARKLRKEGMVPAIVYGHKEATVSVSLSADELQRAIRHGVRVLDLQTDGKMEKALIRDLQWDHLGMELLHVDFTRVSADERVRVQVPLEIRGIAPGVTAGGVLDQPIHQLQIECPAISIPDHIRVNIGELQLDQAIHIKDVVMPPGVTALGDPEAIVVHVTAPKVEAEPGAAPLAGAV